MGRKYSIEYTVGFSKSLYFYSHKKCHSLLGISEKAHVKVNFQKTEFDKYAASGASFFSSTSVSLIQFIMVQNVITAVKNRKLG